MEIDQKGLLQSEREVKSLQNQYKWHKLDLKKTEWSSKYRILDQCSQSFTSRDKSSEYLARLIAFKNKKINR